MAPQNLWVMQYQSLLRKMTVEEHLSHLDMKKSTG